MNIKRLIRRICLVLMDSVIIAVSSFLALLIRFDLNPSAIESQYVENAIHTLPILIAETLIVFFLFRIYNKKAVVT